MSLIHHQDVATAMALALTGAFDGRNVNIVDEASTTMHRLQRVRRGVSDPRAGPAPEGPPVLARLDQCQTCFMCELYCDADAIYVAPDQHGPEPVDPAQILSSGQIGRLRHDYGWDDPDDRRCHLRESWRLGPLLREGAEIAGRRYAAKASTLSTLETMHAIGL